jgi:hypothetical protein
VRIPRNPFLRRQHAALVAAVAALVTLLVAGGAAGALKAPLPLAPNDGAPVGAMPAFAWSPVAGAEEYEFQVSADAGFNSPVLGRGKDDFRTKNTRATLSETAPNGTYWWRVRAIARTGTPSAWSRGRSFRKSWASGTRLLSPVGGAAIVYPRTSLKLSWLPVAGARKYLVSLATDPRLGSLVPMNGAARPVETSATTFTPAAALAPGRYYWGVTALDAEGNRGIPSAVGSFTWTWPSTTALHLSDLAAAPELFDPRFTWDAVAGAARYEVEINSSVDFAPGSKVCCTGTTVNTSLSPTVVFKSNTYYWRVRAIDMDGHAGVWNYGPSFTKTFDNVPPVTAPSVKNLHMRDNVSDPGVDTAPATLGYQTQVPIVTWSPVPGASSYQVDVTPFVGGLCLWSASGLMGHWTSTTAVTAWTPLGTGWNFTKPYPDPHSVATDSVPLNAGPHCVRVRARSDRAGSQDVYGDYTYLDPDTLGWAFDWTGYPAGNACTPTCSAGYAGSGDYRSPVGGTISQQTPLFTWSPIAGAASYFVIVAKDPSFTNIVDYAFTHLPAYAPRTSNAPTTYPDETTHYYWAVLPEAGFNGMGGAGDPLLAAPQNFQKRSTPPQRVFPANGNVFFDQPRFQWTPVTGARTYRLQISQDPSFGTPIEDVTTDSTAYSSNTTHPADTILYWRVRANDENGIGLTWSNAAPAQPWTFQKKLTAPVGSPTNPTQGDAIPNWTWNAVPGAVAYDISVDLPDGTHRDFSGFRSPSVTPVLMHGTGIFHWRVRAEFPRSQFGLTAGPYSQTYSFTRTIREPLGAHADFDVNHVLLSWNPKAGAKRYRVQISGTPDFAQLVENVGTDNTSYAPVLKYFGFRTLNTGRLYWRVAAMDEGDNVGDFTQPQLISRTRRMEITLRGALKRGKKAALTIMVSDFETAGGVGGARVHVTGAGLRKRARTSSFGSVRLFLKPKRKGALTISASKAGFRPTSVRLRIR